jgi:lauroyl/myristoyl acyltransferase
MRTLMCTFPIILYEVLILIYLQLFFYETILKLLLLLYFPYYSKKIKTVKRIDARHVIHAISCGLCISGEDAFIIYNRGIESFIRFKINFLYLSRLPRNIIEYYIGKVTVINPEIINEIQNTNRPIIIFSVHSGDFYTGFLKLAKLSSTKQTINIVKLAGESKKEQGVYDRIKIFCPNINVLRFNQEVAKTCFHQLRKKNIVVIMNDIEARVNSRSEVDFMRKKCFMQNGIAQLALSTKSIILPVVNYKDEKGKNILKIEKPIDVALLENENMHKGINRITQGLANHMEIWLKSFPEQFHYWDYIADTLYAIQEDKVNLNVEY